MRRKLVTLGALLFGLAAAPAAQKPAAVVEQVSAPTSGVQEMSYLAPGQTIELAPGTTLILDYLDSCVNETIKGGHVQIGTTQSEVAGGTVSRTRPDCDGDALLQLTAAESDRGGAAVWRNLPADSTKLPPPALVLKGVFPLVVAEQPGTAIIQRLDRPAPPVSLVIARLPNVARPRGDLLGQGAPLQPGGLYQITMGDNHSLVFKIDEDADSDGLLVGRLLPL